MVNSLDADDAIFGIAILVISHPLAVGTLLGVFIGGDETFEGDFSVGRNRQAGRVRLESLQWARHARRPPNRARFGRRSGLRRRTARNIRGSAPDDGDDWTGLSALHVFFFDDTAVVRRRGADADAIFVEYLIAIGADVDDARCRDRA